MTAFSWRTSFSIAVILVELIQHAEHVVEEFAQYVTKRESEPASRKPHDKETVTSLQPQRQIQLLCCSFPDCINQRSPGDSAI